MIVEEELVVGYFVMELLVMEVRWKWCLILAVVAFAEVEDLETVCLEAVGVAVVVEEKLAVAEVLPVADAAQTVVESPETAAVLAIAALPLLVSAAGRDVVSEGLYELPPPRPPVVPDDVAAPVEAGVEAEPLVSEPVSPFPSLQVIWWEHSDRGSVPVHHELPSSRCLPRR